MAPDPGLQFGPDPVVGPGVDRLVGIALQVHPLHGLRALADQREAAVGVAVDQFGGTLGCLAQDAEPGERVLAPELPALALRDLPPADAPRPVGADQVVAAHLVGRAVRVAERDSRPSGVQIDDRRVGDPEAHVAAVAIAGPGEIDEDVGLRVEPDRGPDQRFEVDPRSPAPEREVDPGVLVALAQHAVGDVRVDQKPDAVPLEDARADGLLDLDAGSGRRRRRSRCRSWPGDDSASVRRVHRRRCRRWSCCAGRSAVTWGQFEPIPVSRVDPAPSGRPEAAWHGGDMQTVYEAAGGAEGCCASPTPGTSG